MLVENILKTVSPTGLFPFQNVYDTYAIVSSRQDRGHVQHSENKLNDELFIHNPA